MTIEQRVLAALCDSVDGSWQSLMRLFDADPEAFYLLACDGENAGLHGALQELADLAGAVRVAVLESYEIVPNGATSALKSATGRTVAIPSALVADVARFLRRVDGKCTSDTPGKDYEGTEVSEAEVRFKLGDRRDWAQDEAIRQERLEARPFVLRVSEEEFSHLAKQPAYVTHGLLNCARQAVLASTSKFRGLKRGDDGPPYLSRGRAFCNKPRQAFDNNGSSFASPAGMVYLVYATEDGYVFDWDWVREDPIDKGYPIDWRLRFDEQLSDSTEAVLDLPRSLQVGTFEAREACYSSRGDCIFCYMTDDVAYAERINSDLTVFYALDRGDITGFKVKNVRRILQQDKSIILADAPGLTVYVDAVLLASLRQHKDRPDSKVEVYTVVIRALHQRIPEPPKVRVPFTPCDKAAV